jgi:hypothetical protein
VVLVDAPKYGVYELQLFLLALFLMQLPKLIFFFTSTLDTVFDLRRLVSGSELDDAAVVVLVVLFVVLAPVLVLVSFLLLSLLLFLILLLSSPPPVQSMDLLAPAEAAAENIGRHLDDI